MDYNLAREIRFFSENEVSDAQRIADRILYNVELNHWVLYSSYLYALLILCIAHKKINNGEMPIVYTSDIREILNLPINEVKEFIMSTSMVHFPQVTYNKSHQMIQDIMKTRPKESESILETAVEYFNKYTAVFE